MKSDFSFVKHRRAALIAALVAVAAVMGVFAYTRLQTCASHSVTLRWSPSPGATSYNIYRSRVSGVRGSQIGTSSTPSYIDRPLPAGTTFYYTVTAVRDGRESGPSNEAKAVIP
jgi:fibronectin type 3 domain-containing protein